MQCPTVVPMMLLFEIKKLCHTVNLNLSVMAYCYTNYVFALGLRAMSYCCIHDKFCSKFIFDVMLLQ